MSFEPLYVETWIYATLHDDDTLTDALAAVNGEAPGYQQGVYLHLAPQKDRTSGRPPAVPYIVVTRNGSARPHERALCGGRVRTDPVYAVTVWDAQNGAVAMDRVTDVCDRVDALLDNQAQTATAPTFRCYAVDSDTDRQAVAGGEVLYGVVMIFEFQTGV